MKRDLKSLAGESFDVVIIGGGIYGVAVAWDAVLRGLKVAIIERGDFGGATSSNSMKTIHGGLRYLQNFDFYRMRQSVLDRRSLMITAPHLVDPLPFVIPVSGYGSKSRAALFIALLLNDIISFDRNRRINDPAKRIPAGRIISKAELATLIPEYDISGVSGGALWYDCQCFSTERLAISYLLSSAERGAMAANYVECSGLIMRKDKIIGVSVRDLLSGEQFDIKSGIVVNAAGPWVDSVLRNIPRARVCKHFKHSSAMNIIVRGRIFDETAVGLPAPMRYADDAGNIRKCRRILFFVPWREYTIIGTDHRTYSGAPDEYRVTEYDIQSFIEDINEAYPAACLKRDDVTFLHCGLLPAKATQQESGPVKLDGRYTIHDHSDEGLPGLITIVGVKYTTHRSVAEKVTDMIVAKLGKGTLECRTDITLVQGSGLGIFNEFLESAIRDERADSMVITHLVRSYGSDYGKILSLAESVPSLGEKIKGSREVIKAEVVNAVRNEMAVKLSDVIFRRTDLGSAEFPGTEAIHEVASIMASELGWDDARTSSEVCETTESYPVSV